ncbi:MAG TPA: coenzyme F420-0:L-glutamate ligase [Candidatus Woesebacteria bacterium]|nr:coenzyme F420-0:L-glutamate ligase [Candidatus Woesebacteria bacterium]
MKVNPIKTKPIVAGDELFKILDESIVELKNNSVVAVTSKIVSICEGSVVKMGEKSKDSLIIDQADYYLPEKNKYNFFLSIKNNIMIPSAGIDESNGNGNYVLWPKYPQKSVNLIREYLSKKFKLDKLGVIIVDSKTTPLRWGVTGVAMSYSGFRALNNYIGTKDIFGKEFRVEKVNVADALAASAVLVMGEGNEQTPIVIIEDVPFVEFRDKDPSKEELEEMAISMEDDLYGQILGAVKWEKGGGSKR